MNRLVDHFPFTNMDKRRTYHVVITLGAIRI